MVGHDLCLDDLPDYASCGTGKGGGKVRISGRQIVGGVYTQTGLDCHDLPRYFSLSL